MLADVCEQQVFQKTVRMLNLGLLMSAVWNFAGSLCSGHLQWNCVFLWWYKLCDFTLFHSWVLNNENQCRCFSFFPSDVLRLRCSKKKNLISVNTLLSGWVNFGSKNEPNFSFQQRFPSFRLIIEMMAEHGIFHIATAHSTYGPAVVVECHR